MVNCGLPRMNGLVPSRGSTRKNKSPVLRHVPGRRGLLGNDRNARCRPRQACKDDVLGLPIGDGYGAVVRLGLDRHAGRKMRHLHAGGRQRDAQETFGKLLHLGGVHGSPVS